MGKLCFAVLVHNRRDVMIDLLDNIRAYCPDSTIILYNGGDDPDLCRGLGYPVCPTSRKLKYGVTAIYMLETMKWLLNRKEPFDYLINLDSDVLFARQGFETFIGQVMEDKDYMGVGNKIPDDDFYCLVQLRKERSLWKPLLGDEPYFESFNVGQVYSRSLVEEMVRNPKADLFEATLRRSKVFGSDELVYATMAERLGFELHAYPRKVGATIRYRPHFQLDDFIGRLNRNPAYLFHPVYRNLQDETRAFARQRMAKQLQWGELDNNFFAPAVQEHVRLPYRFRRNDSDVIAWVAAAEDEGMLYWETNHRDPRSFRTMPVRFGEGRVKGLHAIESRYGNVEVIARVGDKLIHYWRNEETGDWFPSEPITDEASGHPVFIESSYGNFEAVAPLESGGLGHWWRDAATLEWNGPVRFGEGHPEKCMLVQNNSGQLTAVVVEGKKLLYYVRDDGKTWDWFGPYD